jgi:hypothetical protein
MTRTVPNWNLRFYGTKNNLPNHRPFLREPPKMPARQTADEALRYRNYISFLEDFFGAAAGELGGAECVYVTLS